MKLRCYCCGEPITGRIALVSMQPDAADRVFLFKPDHVERADDAAQSMIVTKVSR